MVSPKSFLTPDSQQWGRSIEQRLRDLETKTGNLDTMVSGNNARLSSLSTAIGTLKTQQVELTSQQAELASQQDTLVTQQAQIVQIIADIPISSVLSDSSTNYAIGGSSTICSVSIPWESGKTRCDVMASMNGLYKVPGAAALPVWRLGIASYTSNYIWSSTYGADYYTASGGFSRSVTSGSTFTVVVKNYSGAATIAADSLNQMQLSVLAIFSN